MLTSDETAPMLPGLESAPDGDRSTKWFSEIGCVVREGTKRQVFVAGTLVCSFDEDDRLARNVVVVGLAESGGHIGRLARAFEISEQTVRVLRKKHARGGAAALVPQPKRPPRSKPKLNGRQRRVIERRFELGKRPSELVAWVEEKYGVKRSTVYAIHREWRARRAKRTEGVTAKEGVEPEQVPRAVAEIDDAIEPAGDEVEAGDEQEARAAEGEVASTHDGGEGGPEDVPEAATEARVTVRDAQLEPGTTRNVQPVGTWLMLAMVMKLGLYDVLTRAAAAKRLPLRGVRLALDATIAALSIGERSVEGVRRVATPTAGSLLRARQLRRPRGCARSWVGSPERTSRSRRGWPSCTWPSRRAATWRSSTWTTI
jgi:transposase